MSRLHIIIFYHFHDELIDGPSEKRKYKEAQEATRETIQQLRDIVSGLSDGEIISLTMDVVNKNKIDLYRIRTIQRSKETTDERPS